MAEFKNRYSNTVSDYLKWRGDLRFENEPVNEIDIYIFTQFIMSDFRGIISSGNDTITLQEAAKRYLEIHGSKKGSLGVIQSPYALDMMKIFMNLDRYKDIKLHNHVSELNRKLEEQFSATTFDLTDELSCVIFRGTDDTIIGWKEDFNFAVYDLVHAQEDAAIYLTTAMNRKGRDFVVCGHSKGGNLAVYSSSVTSHENQDRIRFVLNMDGPGFSKKFLEREGYKRIEDKITTLLSNNSLIGTLLNTPGHCVINKTRVVGPLAHDCYTWNVGVNTFERTDALSPLSEKFDFLLTETLDSLSLEDKKAFVDELFDAFLSTGAVTITDIVKMGTIKGLEILKDLGKYPHVEKFSRTFHMYLVKELANASKTK